MGDDHGTKDFPRPHHKLTHWVFGIGYTIPNCKWLRIGGTLLLGVPHYPKNQQIVSDESSTMKILWIYWLSIYLSIHPSIYLSMNILSMYNIYIHIKITFFTGYFWQFQGVSPRFLEGDASDAGFNPWHGPCLDLEVSGISGWKVAWNIKKQRSRVDAGTHLGGMRLTSKFPSSKSPRLAGSC